MRPHDETRNDVGARIPLGRTPLPPTASRTRRKTDLSIKMSRADNIGWTLDNTAFLPTSTCLSLKSWPYREYPIMFTQIPPSDHIIVRCIPTSLHARRLTLRRDDIIGLHTTVIKQRLLLHKPEKYVMYILMRHYTYR